MRANEAYRQRFQLSEGLQARADYHRKRIAAALQKVIDAGALYHLEAPCILAPLGSDASAVESYGRFNIGDGLAVEVSTDAGSVYGCVCGNEVDLRTSGGIPDGGCLSAKGH